MKSQARAFSLASFHMATACWWYTFPMSIDGTYNIEVETKLGTQTGTAKVTTQGDKVEAELDAPIVGKVNASGTCTEDGSFKVAGTARLLLARIDYTVEGSIKGDKLTATVKAADGQLSVKGTRAK